MNRHDRLRSSCLLALIPCKAGTGIPHRGLTPPTDDCGAGLTDLEDMKKLEAAVRAALSLDATGLRHEKEKASNIKGRWGSKPPTIVATGQTRSNWEKMHGSCAIFRSPGLPRDFGRNHPASGKCRRVPLTPCEGRCPVWRRGTNGRLYARHRRRVAQIPASTVHHGKPPGRWHHDRHRHGRQVAA